VVDQNWQQGKPDNASRLKSIFQEFSIPDAFGKERELSVSHSFGTQTTAEGFCGWFHFLVSKSGDYCSPAITYLEAETA
jgi:hypothetical protein